MAVAITPKSEFRQVTSISFGYGEVPMTQDEEGNMGWGLPGRKITYCMDEAKKMARRLDKMIRENIANPKRPVLI